MVSPYCFLNKVMIFFSHPLRLLSDRLSSVLHKLSRKNYTFIRVSPISLDGVTGAVCPPVTPLKLQFFFDIVIINSLLIFISLFS